VDAAFLVHLWAAIALAFHFALAVLAPRYATSVVVFAWPALVAEIEKRRRAIIWFGLMLVCVVSILRSYRYVEFAWFPNPPEFSPMWVALHQVPKVMRHVYVLDASNVNPEYLRLILGVPAEIVHIVDINWNCGESKNFVAFDHSIADGAVKLNVTLPACAFFAIDAPIGDKELANGHLYRNNAISYELPEAEPFALAGRPSKGRGLIVRRKMTVHVRPNGPARFIIQHGGPSGVAWFDIP
jgi:hypothetical protein